MSVLNRFILIFVCVMTRKRLFTMFLHSLLEREMEEKNETSTGNLFLSDGLFLDFRRVVSYFGGIFVFIWDSW